MSTRRTNLLIRKIRSETGNEDYGPNAGISDTQIIEYMNDALHFLQRGITKAHALQFTTEAFISTVANQEAYTLPSDFLESGGIISVEYAQNGANAVDPNWLPLEESTDLERSSGFRSTIPFSYIVRGRSLLLNGIPSVSRENALRVVYTKQLTRLDVRRGTVASVTLDVPNLQVDALAITPATATDPDEYEDNEYICIVDRYGNQKMAGIEITGAYNSGTGAITIDSSFTYESGETIAVGDYVVFGKDSSTHQLDLNESVESFLVAYAAWKVLRQDSNSDSAQQLTEFTGMRDDILSAYAQPNQSLQHVPEV